jgi:hypothetical protein
MFRLTTFRRYLTTTARRLNADAPAAASRPALRITHVDAPAAAAAAPRSALRITHVDATNFGRPPRPRNDGGAPRFTSNDRPRGPRPATDRPRRPPPRSARGARSEAAKPSQARFTAASQAASSAESSSSSSSSSASLGPLLPVPKEQPYVPSALTVEDLLPDVPSTALTMSGLSSALIRETAALRSSSGRNFAGYQRRRAGVMKTVVEGRYQKLLGTPQQGKVLDEARRLVARNGSIPNAAKVAVVKDVKAMVGELALAAPQERAKIAAA